ncbi:MAG: CoA pyrophosphatase [Halioglobus sp.]
MLTPAVITRLANRLPLDGLAWDDSSAPQAAVLVALTDEEQPRVVLGRRAAHLQHHPGEVAFPGGKREPEDGSPWVTARREAHEEVGIIHEDVHPLGELSPLMTRTGFEVHPCVAMVPASPELVVDSGEFDSVFLMHLEAFADPDVFRLETMSDGPVQRKVAHYTIAGDTIWGVTAAVLAQLANVAYDAELKLE